MSVLEAFFMNSTFLHPFEQLCKSMNGHTPSTCEAALCHQDQLTQLLHVSFTYWNFHIIKWWTEPVERNALLFTTQSARFGNLILIRDLVITSCINRDA